VVVRIGLPALVLALVTVACGGSATPLEAYFDEVDGVTAVFADEVSDLPIAGTESTLDDVRTYFAGIHAALARAEASLVAVSAPDEAGGAHPEFVIAVRDFAVLTEKASELAEAMETREDLFDLANDPIVGVNRFNALQARTVSACRDLQAVAEAESIDVDLGCPLLGDG
jgi:hypothetical protein